VDTVEAFADHPSTRILLELLLEVWSKGIRRFFPTREGRNRTVLADSVSDAKRPGETLQIDILSIHFL
jgi:hypothetical protein